MKKTLSIEGMSCGSCVKHTSEALEKIDGVSSVSVDLETKTAVIESDAAITDDVLKSVVSGAGYTVVAIS